MSTYSRESLEVSAALSRFRRSGQVLSLINRAICALPKQEQKIMTILSIKEHFQLTIQTKNLP